METCEMLVQVYGREAMSIKCVYEWFKRFRKGKETTENESCSGRPLTSRTPEMIKKMQQMLAQDRRLMLRLIIEEWALARTRHTQLSAMIWVRGRSAPDLCRTSSQKSRKRNGWRLHFHVWLGYPLLLENIAMGDETWCYQFDLESKWQSMAWYSPTSPWPKESHLQKSKHCWLPSSKTKASSIRNLFLKVKPLMPHFIR